MNFHLLERDLVLLVLAQIRGSISILVCCAQRDFILLVWSHESCRNSWLYKGEYWSAMKRLVFSSFGPCVHNSGTSHQSDFTPWHFEFQFNPFPTIDKYICLPELVFGTRLFYCIVVYCCCPAGTPPTFDYSTCALSMYF